VARRPRRTDARTATMDSSGNSHLFGLTASHWARSNHIVRTAVSLAERLGVVRTEDRSTGLGSQAQR